MPQSAHKIILGSRSPRRKELLALLVPAWQLEVLVPRQSEEPGFENRHTWPQIEKQIQKIARSKNDDVCQQLRADSRTGYRAVLTADTIIVASASRLTEDVSRKKTDGPFYVLGQPGRQEDWQQEVHNWFENYLWNREHWALTALCLTDQTGQVHETTAKTTVTFGPADPRLLDWYLSTGEPRGKAGGYAIQGAGSLFVTSVTGSLSNVIGLPLEALRELFHKCQIEMLPQP